MPWCNTSLKISFQRWKIHWSYTFVIWFSYKLSNVWVGCATFGFRLLQPLPCCYYQIDVTVANGLIFSCSFLVDAFRFGILEVNQPFILRQTLVNVKCTSNNSIAMTYFWIFYISEYFKSYLVSIGSNICFHNLFIFVYRPSACYKVHLVVLIFNA